MGQAAGETATALAAQAGALAARDAAAADADRILTDLLRGAHALAIESVRRIDAVRAEIDASVARRTVDDAASARDVARFLLEKNRELITIVTAARTAASAKCLALEELSSLYRGELPA